MYVEQCWRTTKAPAQYKITWNDATKFYKPIPKTIKFVFSVYFYTHMFNVCDWCDAMRCCSVPFSLLQLDEVHCVSAKEFRLLHNTHCIISLKFVDLLDANLFWAARWSLWIRVRGWQSETEKAAEAKKSSSHINDSFYTVWLVTTTFKCILCIWIWFSFVVCNSNCRLVQN